jgi:hypothetical protein
MEKRSLLHALLAGMLALLYTLPAAAQWRMMPEAIVGLERIPYLVHDLEAASTTWRDLGFNVKPGGTWNNGIAYNGIKFEDGAGIELLMVPEAVDKETKQYREMLEDGEGPAAFALYAPDLRKVNQAIGDSRFKYGPVSRKFDRGGLEFLSIAEDSRSPADRAYTQHPNGAKAMSRIWIATSAGTVLRDLLVALGADSTVAKVYAPEAVQSYDMTVSNGEILILPRSDQLICDRPVIGATFEVEDLDKVRERLDIFGIAWTAAGTENRSIVVAPDATHGMWVEFRE